MKTKFYELPDSFKKFVWVMICLLNILVVFSACYTSARSVQGYTLAVTAFVLLLLYYAHEKRWRHLFAYVLIAYAFYSILVHSFTCIQAYADRETYLALGPAYTVFLYGGSYIPYIFGAIAAATTAVLGFVLHKKGQSVFRLMKTVFTASIIILLLTSLIS